MGRAVVGLALVMLALLAAEEGVALLEGPGAPRHRDRLATDSIACSEEAKACFRLGRALHEPSGKCFRLASQGPCPAGHEFVALREVLDESDAFAAGCRSEHVCDEPGRVRMRDGHCYDARPAGGAFVGWWQCPLNASLLVMRDIFGLGVCCAPADCAAAQTGALQPQAAGRCFLPQVAFRPAGDAYPRARHPLEGARVRCDAREAHCLARGGLPGEGGACWPPLQTCGADAWVVADAAAFETTRALRATCARPRCAPGRVFVAAGGQCVALWELQQELCAGDELLFDLFGEAHCARGVPPAALLALPQPVGGAGSGECALPPAPPLPATPALPPPAGRPAASVFPALPADCAPSDSGDCARPVVSEVPKPEAAA